MPGVARRTRASAPGHVRGIDWSHPLAHGLVFAAPFGESRLRDAVSGRAIALQGTGAVATAPSRGAALQSNGTFGNGADVADAPALNTSRVTLAMSVRITDVTGSAQYQIGGKPYTAFSPPYYQYAFAYVGTTNSNTSFRGVIRFSISIGNTWKVVDSPTYTAVSGQWLRLVGTYNGAYHALYVNGVEVAGAAQTGNLDSFATSLRLGYAAPLQLGFAGFTQDARVYNRGWSADEVRDDYRNQWAVYDQGARTYFIPAAGGGATTDVPLTTFSVSPQAPTTLRSLISNVPTL